MWRHLAWALGDRGGAWFQVDDKLDISNRGHSGKFFWKDILEVTNDRNVLNIIQW